jgi:hypothetical protein
MKVYYMDLHVHTVLSPCAELDMGAPDIVDRCIKEGINIIAITDHNAAKNSLAVKKAASGTGVEVIFGLEVQSVEDVHVLCYFEEWKETAEFETWVWDHLPPVDNIPEKFGMQLIIDERNRIKGQESKFLLQGITKTADEIIHKAKTLGGVCVLAHIDREAFSYMSVLGFLPDDLEVDAVEVSKYLTKAEVLDWKRKVKGRPVIRSSDAHRLSDLKKEHATPVLLESPTLEEIVMAFRGASGRKVLWP